MAGKRRLLLLWDPNLDGAFRRRFERALGELDISAADAQAVDIDPDAPSPVRLALVGASAETGSQRDADLIVLAGPGDFPDSTGAFRLDTTDIDSATRRWTNFCAQLGRKIGAESLAAPPEKLAELYDEAKRQATQAEQARNKAVFDANTAINAQKQAVSELAAERARASALAHEVERLSDLVETTAFSIIKLPAAERAAVERARTESRLARDAAARAEHAARLHPDALAWPKANAVYSGETRNRQPHGFGVMTFRDGSGIVATYRGEFIDGLRAGHGVAASDGDHTWSGQWSNGEAQGYGLLETPDGRRFEGEVVAAPTGELRPGAGWTWSSGGKPAAAVHTQAPPLLPAPHQADT